jgi:hypothetical protein
MNPLVIDLFPQYGFPDHVFLQQSPEGFQAFDHILIEHIELIFSKHNPSTISSI